MIDSNTGYLKLIDFGAAIKFNEINITNTLTGTPNYMAPEVLKGKGYGFSCDYWSVGVIAFELFYNYYPFGNEANEPIEVYEEIINKELKFPNDNNILMNELIRCLLEKETYKRICCLKQVKETEMFQDFKWDDIINMEMHSPVIEENTIDNKTINELKEYTQKYFDVIDKEDIRIEGTESNISYESSLETNEQQLLKNNWTHNF
jgi:serine/threonine protein kinase